MPFISNLAGRTVAPAFGALDGEQLSTSGWFGIPELPPLGLDFTPDKQFWALLPTFAVLTLVLGIKV